MAGTAIGGKKAAATNKAKFGDDFYKKIGGMQHSSWIANGRKPRGFLWMKINGQLYKVVAAGKMGGRISRLPKIGEETCLQKSS